MAEKKYLGIEKRGTKRKIAKFTIRYKIISEKETPPSTATTFDISQKSVSFETPDSIPMGTKIEAEMSIPALPKPLKVKGSINRIEEIEKNKLYLYSLLFEEIDKKAEAFLTEFVQVIDLNRILRTAKKQDASDIHLVANQPPIFRIHGDLIPTEEMPLRPKDLEEIILSILTVKQKEVFAETLELDFSYLTPEGDRFRANVHLDKGNIEVAFRILHEETMTIFELNLPKVVEDLARRKKGLIIVTGPAGTGKTTTLASMIELINKERKCMIISIEDPIEHVHKSQKSIIKQREVGADTLSFTAALKHILRQDPNVILIGEIRDLDSVSIAITAAETGHLVLTTLHAPDTVECINRIMDVYPGAQQSQVRCQLAGCLEGIVAQLLIPRKDGTGRVPAVEILIATPAIKNLIRTGQLNQIITYLEAGTRYGMQSMDNALLELIKQDLVEKEAIVGYIKNPKIFGAKF